MVRLVGQREADAMTILRAQGLTLGTRSEERDDNRAGLVIAQQPRPNTRVKPGDAVSIVVARSGKVMVPLVIGMTLEQAQRALRRAELTPGEITHAAVTHEKAGLVINQNPVAGSVAEQGDKVVLEIGRASGRVRRPPAERIARIGRIAEERLRAAGLAQNEPADFVAMRLADAGISDAARLDQFLAQPPRTVRGQLGLRTLAETKRAISFLRRAR